MKRKNYSCAGSNKTARMRKAATLNMKKDWTTEKVLGADLMQMRDAKEGKNVHTNT